MNKNRRKLLTGIATLPLIGFISLTEATEIDSESLLTIDAAKGLSLAEIPRGIIEELYEKYHKIEWALDKKINERTHTFQLLYNDTSTKLETHTIIDSGSSKPNDPGKCYTTKKVQGYKIDFYCARIELIDNHLAIIRRVLPMGHGVNMVMI